mgnify:FL=1
MFVHIGNNIILKQEDIIGIFNIKAIKNTNEYIKIINNLKENNKLIKIENTEENTLIITEKNKIIKGYITNISSVTIEKRLKNTNFN